MNTLRNRSLLAIASSLAVLVSCAADDLDGLGDDLGFRAAASDSDDPVAQQVIDDIDATLPESQDATIAHPELFPAGFDPDPEVTQADTDVWVTFIKEGASYRSALGFFTYPDGSPPTTGLSIQELEDGIIFDNASQLGSGGSLYNGIRMHLGTFQPGTRIGFYLVGDGYCTNPGVGSCSDAGVDFTKPIYYTIDALNPEPEGQQRHVVMADLLNETSDLDARLLSFEDLDRSKAGTDHDFNDVVFRVTASPDLGGDDGPTIPSGGGVEFDSPGSTSTGSWCPSTWNGTFSHTLLLGDVDGDGLDDQICWRSDGAVFQALSIDGVSHQTPGATVLGGVVQSPWCPSAWNGSFSHRLLLGDVNGDGLDDQICARSDGAVFHALSIDGVSYQTPGATVLGGVVQSPWCPSGWNGTFSHRLLLGDVDGDGLDDQICARSDGAVFQALSIDGVSYETPGATVLGGVAQSPWCPSAGNGAYTHTLMLGDFDGDGRDDQVCVRSDGAVFHALSIDGVDYHAPESTGPSAWCPAGHHTLLLGDTNGDGFDDQVCWRADGAVFHSMNLGG